VFHRKASIHDPKRRRPHPEGIYEVGFEAHQFVAHFMLEDFSDRQNLFSNAAIERMKVVLDMVDRFEECGS